MAESLYRKICIITCAIVTIAFYLWHLIGKIIYIYVSTPSAVAVLDALASCLVAAICVINPLSRFLFNKEKFCTLRRVLKKIDNFLGVGKNDCKIKTTRTKIAVQSFLVLSCAGDMYTKIRNIGYDIYKYNFVNIFFLQWLSFFVLWFFDFSKTVSNRLVLLNKKIEKLVTVEDHESFRQTFNCMKCHFALCEIFESLGEICGWQILMLQKMCALYMVETIFYCYSYFQHGGLCHISDIICNILWTLTFLVVPMSKQKLLLFERFFQIYAALVLFACDEINREANSTLLLCQDVIRSTKDKTLMRKLLKHFARQIGTVNSQFRCPLELVLDKKTFLKILTDVLNYLIIVFQFDT
ncbi:hypothetical protein Zmor_009484 [Zophobas morio]|uniref:Gustatory receptor n=1 Tax=Zophobas morio TaxID=2755281 RepID=A0AA38MIQ7_9CUCU|nr:hypothetical protein Zmor_009484 [Zophobas morio]